jgi:plastocyanin
MKINNVNMQKNIFSNLSYLSNTILIIALVFVYSACSKDSVNPPANEVWISGSAYSPATITVTLNTTVKWTNKDAIAHTVTSDAVSFDSGNLNSSETYSHQFTTAGSFAYHCTYHSMMHGTVVVH